MSSDSPGKLVSPFYTYIFFQIELTRLTNSWDNHVSRLEFFLWTYEVDDIPEVLPHLLFAPLIRECYYS